MKEIQKTETGKKLCDDLLAACKKNKVGVDITDPKKGTPQVGNTTKPKSETSATEGKPTGSEVTYDPNKKTGDVDVKGGKNRPPWIGLAHELAHALDFATGSAKGKTQAEREKRAEEIENKIRKEAGVPQLK